MNCYFKKNILSLLGVHFKNALSWPDDSESWGMAQLKSKWHGLFRHYTTNKWEITAFIKRELGSVENKRLSSVPNYYPCNFRKGLRKTIKRIGITDCSVNCFSEMFGLEVHDPVTLIRGLWVISVNDWMYWKNWTVQIW